MFQNYLKLAWRNLTKSKIFSFINIFGLAAGTLCSLYIILYVQDQYSYDMHFNDVISRRSSTIPARSLPSKWIITC